MEQADVLEFGMLILSLIFSCCVVRSKGCARAKYDSWNLELDRTTGAVNPAASDFAHFAADLDSNGWW